MQRKANIGGTWPSAKGHPEPPEEQDRLLPQSLCRERGPRQHPDSRSLASRAVRGCISPALNHEVCDRLLRQLRLPTCSPRKFRRHTGISSKKTFLRWIPTCDFLGHVRKALAGTREPQLCLHNVLFPKPRGWREGLRPGPYKVM